MWSSLLSQISLAWGFVYLSTQFPDSPSSTSHPAPSLLPHLLSQGEQTLMWSNSYLLPRRSSWKHPLTHVTSALSLCTLFAFEYLNSCIACTVFYDTMLDKIHSSKINWITQVSCSAYENDLKKNSLNCLYTYHIYPNLTNYNPGDEKKETEG